MNLPDTDLHLPFACCCSGVGRVDWPLNALISWLKSARNRKSTMNQTITKSAKDIVKTALTAVSAISVEEALSLVESPNHVFVDLRDGTEQAKTGIIPGAVQSSRGMIEFHIDPKSPIHKPKFNQDKTFVFYCASGGRSALAALVAMEMGLTPVVNLSGGVGAWKKAGGKLDKIQ